MLTTQSLKKQLRGIRLTQKLAKAMRTISTVKFSKLNGMHSEYAEYGRQCRLLLEKYGADYSQTIRETDPAAPAAVIVMTANKGLCGNFNAEILKFACEELSRMETVLLVACGKKAISYFKGKKLPIEKEYILSDIPTYEESSAFLEDMIEWRTSGRVSKVYVIYARYNNMVKQTPVMCQLFAAGDSDDNDRVLFVPDRNTSVAQTAKTVFRSMFYGLVLDSAIGAQAATLMTMRSAYDTATEYCARLEGQINRKRQSVVTADVIETSTEWSE